MKAKDTVVHTKACLGHGYITGGSLGNGEGKKNTWDNEMNPTTLTPAQIKRASKKADKSMKEKLMLMRVENPSRLAAWETYWNCVPFVPNQRRKR